jgi:hypothetical protein
VGPSPTSSAPVQVTNAAVANGANGVMAAGLALLAAMI